tara:strand:+ start:95925 stop:97733 length:1809 start_codon:yes stop_codon:yes gene_type:complete
MKNKRLPRIESLSSRLLLAADVSPKDEPAIENAPTAIEQVDKASKVDKVAEATLQVRALGEMMDADESLIEESIKKVAEAIAAGDDVQKVTADTNLAILVDGMALPEEALRSGLTASQLLDFKATLAQIDNDDTKILHDPQTFIQIRKDGPAKGVDNIYKKSIGTQFGVPKSLWDQLTGKQMLDGVSLSEVLANNDEPAQSEKFWSDLEKVQNGTASKGEFLKDWSGGDYTDSPLDDFLGDDDTEDAASGTATENATQSDVADELDTVDDGWIDVDDDTDNLDGEWIDADFTPHGSVTHTPDGGFDLSGISEDGYDISEHFSPDGNGGFTGSEGGYSASLPPEGTYSVETSDDGETFVVVTTGNDDSGGDDDSGDANDDGDGDNDDDSGSADGDSGSSDEQSSDDESESDETPVPDQSEQPDHLLLWALMNAQSPAGQQVLSMIGAAIASAQNYGGTVDPIDEMNDVSDAILVWSMQNPANPVAQAYLKSIDQAIQSKDDAGGTENNPDRFEINVWHLAASKSNIDLIMSGGGRVDPADGDGNTAGLGGFFPVIGPGGGLFGWAQASEDGDDPSDDGFFGMNVDFVLTLNLINIDAFSSALK